MPPRPVTIGVRRMYAPTDAVRREIKFHGAFVCESDRRFVDWKGLKVKRAAGNQVNGKNRVTVRSSEIDWPVFLHLSEVAGEMEILP